MPLRPDYTTLIALKAFLRIESFVADDAFLGQCISTASRMIDRDTRRQFGNVIVAESRVYLPTPRSYGDIFLGIDDVYSATGLLVMNNSVNITAKCSFRPLNAIANNRVYHQLLIPYVTGEVIVTALYGWPSIPVPIAQATLMLASRYYARRDAPFGVIGSAELGNQMNISKIDNDVKQMISAYYRWWA